jgi:hypothetical protein
MLKKNSQEINVKIFDKFNNLIHIFPTIKSAAKHLRVRHCSITKIFKTGISYDEYTYKFELKDLRIRIYDYNNKFIETLQNAKIVSTKYNILRSTLSNYIKSGKLYKNKYFFLSG